MNAGPQDREHPPHDCEDCGRLHVPWSAPELAQARRELDVEADEFGDVAKWRTVALHSVTAEGHPLYVEVEDDMRPTRLHSFTPEGIALYVQVEEPGFLPVTDDNDDPPF